MLLTKEQQDKVLNLLIDDGLVDPTLAKKAYAEAMKSPDKSVLSIMKSNGVATDDCIAHATAIVVKTPYVDLRNLR